MVIALIFVLVINQFLVLNSGGKSDIVQWLREFHAKQISNASRGDEKMVFFTSIHPKSIVRTENYKKEKVPTKTLEKLEANESKLWSFQRRKTLITMHRMIPLKQIITFSPSPIMAASSLSSLFLHPHRRREAATTTTFTVGNIVPLRYVAFSTRANLPQQQNTDTPPPGPDPAPKQERKSFAVATGELFLGIASRILIRGGGKSINGEGREVPAVEMFAEEEGEWWWRGKRKERIASVVKDPVQPEVVWEQRVKDVEAEQRRKAVTSPGFSFSAAGLLFPYHLGVANFLIENGYIKETTPLAGSSAGAIVCAVIASGASMQEALEATKILAEDCRRRGTAFRLGAVLRDVLEKFLPDDAHIRSSGRVRVAVTQILWRPRGLLVDEFESKEDLINAVFTSSFIPGYLAPRPVTRFRNRLCIDGGLTLFMPPTSAAQTVRVCAFPASRLGLEGIGISPDCNPENRASPRELFNWALEPAEDEILEKLFELGYLDAAVWAEDNPVEQIVREDGAYNNNGIAGSLGTRQNVS